jgi:transcriptional regulator GlxA family with amidase domain
VRVEAARRLLETTTDGTAEVARTCGFGTVETMHRAFRRTVHTTPGQYRRHFAATA